MKKIDLTTASGRKSRQQSKFINSRSKRTCVDAGCLSSGEVVGTF